MSHTTHDIFGGDREDMHVQYECMQLQACPSTPSSLAGS
jgi:hypothetical protein